MYHQVLKSVKGLICGNVTVHVQNNVALFHRETLKSPAEPWFTQNSFVTLRASCGLGLLLVLVLALLLL